MTDMEKKVMVRLCAKIVAETDLYETDKEVQNLIDWVCLSEQIKGKRLIIPGIYNKFLVFFSKIMPIDITNKLTMIMMNSH